jgi:AraC-like DNA-binding protein
METKLRRGAGGGLERSCRSAGSDWLRSRPLAEGVHALQAWFAGHAFDRHRHDTYAIGVTDEGVQAFDYRGAARIRTPGQVVVLHPDEAHDGHAGTPDGFGYRIVYVAPARIGEAVLAICGRRAALPFVRPQVSADGPLASAVNAAFQLDPEPLAVDALVLSLAEALVAADPSCAAGARRVRVDANALARARLFLDAETARVVRSSELEQVSGLERYDLARQFRAAFATSPYRYSLLRRLDRARAELARQRPPGAVALATGFADQAHLTRMFRRAFGMTPGRYAALDEGAGR